MSKRLEMISLVIQKGSRDPFHWYARAMELRSLGRLDEALEAYRDVRREFPNYVPTFLMEAQVATEIGDTAAARDVLGLGIRLACSLGEDKAAGEMDSLLRTLPQTS